MATTIGRAGKQLFTTIQVDANEAAVSSPKPALSRESSNIHHHSTTPNPPQSSSNGKLRRKSKDTLDLENTLEECLNLKSSIDEPLITPRFDKSPMLHASQRTTPNFGSKGSILSPHDTFLRSYTNLSVGSCGSFNKLNRQSSDTTIQYDTNNTTKSSTLSPKGTSEPDASLSTLEFDPTVMDKEQLLAAMEVLKMQNQMLTNKVQKTQLESIRQIEKERTQRFQMIHTLEQENQTLLNRLMEQKVAAEQQLENEKLVFIDKMQSMEEEKTILEQQVHTMEEQNQQEMGFLVMQKYEMEKRMKGLMHEKEQFVQEKQQNNETAEQRLKLLEEEKLQLVKQLQENDDLTQAQHKKLHQEMTLLQSNLTDKMNQFETTKSELTNKLQMTEKQVQEQNVKMQIQLEKQQQQSLALLNTLEDEKLKLLAFASHPEEEEPSLTHDKKPQLHSQLTAKTALNIQEMIEEKDNLQLRLRQSAEQAKLRVKEIKEKLAKKQKKKLGQQVTKMKAITSPNSNKYDDSEGSGRVLSGKKENINSNHSNHSQLTPKRSLFDMFTTATSPSDTTNTTNSNKNKNKNSIYQHNNAYEIISAQNVFSLSSSNHSLPSTNNHTNTNNTTTTGAAKTFMDVDDDEEDKEDANNNGKDIKQKVKKQSTTSSSSSKHTQQPASTTTTTINTTATNVTPAEQQVETANTINTTTTTTNNKTNDDNDNFNTPDTTNTTDTATEHELPAPHIAAANNQLTKLQMYYNLDDELLFSLDHVYRQPLFYAGANGHLMTVQYFVSLCDSNPSKLSDLLYHVDAYGDCILHAVASSGQSEVVEYVLTIEQTLLKSEFFGYSPPNQSLASKSTSSYNFASQLVPSKLITIKNSTGMTATHLAQNDTILTLLALYGSNMSAKDYYQRTPLFIACAMNKACCVEYFITNVLDVNEETENILLIKDYRGDTPLHAAACNNAVDCLLLLLQCGIDPRIMNQQGLKAIDLAIRNKHHRCQEILAEYYLHYCTSSEFDSVLFLAALEGHRVIANSATNSAHNQSMFTLKENNTMRLQRYGVWIAYNDPTGNTNTIFWYHTEKNIGQWEIPEEVKAYQAKEAALASHKANESSSSRLSKAFEQVNTSSDQKLTQQEAQLDKTLQAKMSMRMKRQGDWIQYTTTEATEASGSGIGRTFFYNQKNGMFQWHSPFEGGGDDVNGGDKKQQKQRKEVEYTHNNSSEEEGEYETTIRVDDDSHCALSVPNTIISNNNSISNSSKKKALKHKLPSYYTDWKPYVDESNQSIFWYNSVSKVSQWENPFEQLQQAADLINDQRLQALKANESFFHPKATLTKFDEAEEEEAYNTESKHTSPRKSARSTARSTARGENTNSNNNTNRTTPRMMRRMQDDLMGYENDDMVYAVMNENDLGI